MDAMRSMDVPRDPGSLTRMFSFPYHVLPARVLVCSLSRFTCFFMLPFWTNNSSMLTRLAYAYFFWIVDSFADSLFLDYDSSMTCLSFYDSCTLSHMFVLVSRRPLYIRLGMGTRSPSSIYFATTLKV